MTVAEWIKTIVTIIFSGAFFGFVQFLITRKDKKEETSQEERDKNIKKSMEDHLTNVNAKWKEDYCDKNAKAISELVNEVREGLAEREKTGICSGRQNSLLLRVQKSDVRAGHLLFLA